MRACYDSPMKFIILSLLTLLSLTPVLDVHAKTKSNNGWSSSGGDDEPYSAGAAWFLGNDPVIYCLEKAPDFSVSEAETIKIIKQSVLTWKDYYEKNKKFLNNSSDEINFNFQAGSCNGKEDLKILLGVESEEIRHQKERYFNPFGFAVLKSYNLESKRGKGFVWFADPKKAYPNSHQKSFHAMILHELGHVFGNDHVEGTIMSLSLPKTISNEATTDGGITFDDPAFNKLFTQIDGKRTLFFHHMANWSYEGIMPSQEIAKSLTGRSFREGNLKAVFANNGPNVNYSLKLCENSTCSVIPVTLLGEGTTDTSSTPVFKIVTADGVAANYSKAYDVTGLITSSSGITYMVLITLNLGDISPVRLRLIQNGRLIDIFTQGPVGSR